MTMNSDTVSVLEGNTFVVGRRNGDVDAGPGEPHGLFSSGSFPRHDRLLSRRRHRGGLRPVAERRRSVDSRRRSARLPIRFASTSTRVGWTMEAVGKWLLVFAVVLAIVGGAALLLSRLGVSRLPGDIVIHGKNVTFYFPLGLSIVLSIVLTVVLDLFSRR
jgi:Protein of unknown function (DUF2905)